MSDSMRWLNSRRTALIAMLIAIEVVILGLVLYVMTGGRLMSGSPSGVHHVAFSARPILPIAAGTSPVVTIDDPNSEIIVSPSSDGLVHVVDRTHVGGMVWSAGANISHLRVTRTTNGVNIARPNYSDHFAMFNFGSMTQDVDVEVPKAARVNIVRCAGARVSDVNGDVAVHSVDGRIRAERLQSNTVDLSSNDGHIALADITTNALNAKTRDGHIEIKNLAFIAGSPQATIHTSDGSVRVSGSFSRSGSYNISTGDGRVELALASSSNVSLDASTGDGSISVNGNAQSNDNSDATTRTLSVGDGSGMMHVSSADGSIHITTNGDHYHG